MLRKRAFEYGSKIKNIIFDLGGVLLDFNPKNYLIHCNLNDDEIELFTKMIWGSDEWKKCDRGDINFKEMIEEICINNPTYSKKIQYVLENYNNNLILSEMPNSYEFVKRLKNKDLDDMLNDNSQEESVLKQK